MATASQAQTISAARFVDPTGRYTHGVLGDAIEYGGLELRIETSRSASLSQDAAARQSTIRITLPLSRVFEDIAPRLVDMDGDGTMEVIVVETDIATGAQLAIYDARGRKITATPHIGQTNSWLAPVGAMDLDGDGYVEIAYIDRPHLARTLRIWRYRAGTLTQIASRDGLTNHKIGWDHIPGGIRSCHDAPEIITADVNWTRIIATSLDGARLISRDFGPYDGPDSLNAALACD